MLSFSLSIFADADDAFFLRRLAFSIFFLYFRAAILILHAVLGRQAVQWW